MRDTVRLFQLYQQNGEVVFHYGTKVFIGR